MIVNYRTLRSDPEVPSRSIKNVKHYLENRGYDEDPGRANCGPIVDKECQYIKHESDLLAVVPTVKQPLRRILGRFTWFLMIFRSKRVGSAVERGRTVH